MDSLEPRQHLAANGIRAYYFNVQNPILQSPVLERVDANINFNWRTASPAPGKVNADKFGVIWMGQIKTGAAGTYTFHYTTNNLGRLYVDNRMIINNWKSHGDTTDVATITLAANTRYDLRADFGEDTYTAKAILEWTPPAGTRSVVPNSALFQTDDAPTLPLTQITPGRTWLDTTGNPINAFGGYALYAEGTYYWYGEKRNSTTWNPEFGTANTEGVSVYSSTDLMNWTPRGYALSYTTSRNADLAPGRVIERPRVIYNAATKKYVMWVHVDTADYSYARAAWATSDTPAGPFTYQGSTRPLGFDARDLTLFKDDNGKAYLFFASEGNNVVRVVELNSSYTGFTGAYTTIRASNQREGLAVIKHGGTYHLFTSGATWWRPNEALYSYASSVLGTWTHTTNPFKGPLASTSNNAQFTCILPIAGKPNQYAVIMDRWRPWDLADSRSIWLPMTMTSAGPVFGALAPWKP
jgi:hypothetical protein